MPGQGQSRDTHMGHYAGHAARIIGQHASALTVTVGSVRGCSCFGSDRTNVSKCFPRSLARRPSAATQEVLTPSDSKDGILARPW